VIPISVCCTGGLNAKTQTANQHVLTTPAIGNGDIWALGKILTGSIDLTSSLATIKTILAY
jgi:hypothetical protein